MPTRILKDGFLGSDKITALNEMPTAETLYVRLLLVADDYGRFYASPARIARACWPNREDVVGKSIEALLQRLCEVGLIVVYAVDDHEYIQITNPQQRIRRESVFPDMAAGVIRDNPSVPQSAAIGGELRQNAALGGGGGGGVDEGDVCDERRDDEIIFNMPTKAGKTCGIKQSAVDRWRNAYPNIDVMLQLERAKIWLIANPARGKTPGGMNRFIGNWLSREEQNRINGRSEQRLSAMESLAAREIGPGWDETEENE